MVRGLFPEASLFFPSFQHYSSIIAGNSRRLIRSFLPAILAFILSVILLTLPGSSFPSENWMGNIHLDKFIHVGMFGGLTFLACWGFYCRFTDNAAGTAINKTALWRSFIYVCITAIAYGIIMEYVQRDFIPNRSFDSGDILADGAGAVLGMLYSRYRYIKK
ncbi:MAG: VanZ family protein [Chitinophagaceae bacterium]|nr:MAG: VanZ family protein [Chitinophagaceae bacterium]